MNGQDIWRTEGAKSLLEFLSTATGEEHDAVVYDTKHEFDKQNPDAVRYIAALAMTKASGTEDFEAQMPENGSVLPHYVRPDNTRMLTAFQERKEREQQASGVYVPDARKYCAMVEFALDNRYIAFSNMTAEEQSDHNRSLKKSAHRDRTYMLTHFYLPLGFALLTLIYIIYRLGS